MPLTENDLSSVYTGDVLSASGEKIGSVGQIYLDDQSGEPTFVTANTGLFGMSQSFVPLRGARVENGNVVVDFDKTTVKDAPRIDDDGSLSPAEEDQLYVYYGMGSASADTADYGTADQTPQPGHARADRDDAVTGDSRLGDRADQIRDDQDPGGRHARSEGWGDRPGRFEEQAAATGTMSGGEPRTSANENDGAEAGSTVVETGTSGPVGRAEADATTPDAPPADRDRDGLDRDGLDRDGDRDATPPSGEPARGGRLRKWVMTEYEPVKSEEVYVEGQGQPGERSTR